MDAWKEQAGSSPLTRGKLGELIEWRDEHGLIPAHAGKTTPRNCPAWPVPAHPRSRGENRGGRGLGVGLRGSSPLTRGKPLNGPKTPLCDGLIPAHAGKTSHTT